MTKNLMREIQMNAALWGMALACVVAPAAAQEDVRSLDVKVGDRVEFERFAGRRDRGTIVRLDQGTLGAITAFTVIQDHDNDRYALLVKGSKVRKLDGAAPAAHSAPPQRPRAPCPAQEARQGASASPDLVRALVVCTLEDNSGVYAGKTINVDVLSFRMGRSIRNRDAPVSLRYADPNATLHNGTVRYNQRIYGNPPRGSVTHFDGVERNFTVYVDLHNRWAVGWSRVSDGQMRTTALPR